jgi:hypothetical protein
MNRRINANLKGHGLVQQPVGQTNLPSIEEIESELAGEILSNHSSEGECQ